MSYTDFRLTEPAATLQLHWLRTVLRRVLFYGSAAALAIALSGSIFTFTPLVGISLAHTQGESMEPLHKSGDVVMLKEIDGARAAIGDVVVFRTGERKVLHRVIDRYANPAGQLMLVTQGDNEPLPDDPILASQVSGRLVTTMPLLGDISRLLDGRGGIYVYRSTVIAVCTFSVVIWGLVTSTKAAQRRREAALSEPSAVS